MIEYIITKPTLSESEVANQIEKIIAKTDISTQTTISVLPKYVECAGIAIGDSSNITICAISTGSLYSYPEVAVLECSMACENGADQIEAAISTDSEISDFSQTESYLKIVAEEIEDVAEFSILISEQCGNLESVITQALKASADLGSTIISYGLYKSPVEQVALAAKIVEDYNNSSSNKITLRVITDISIDNIGQESIEFINKHSLASLQSSSSLMLRVRVS